MKKILLIILCFACGVVAAQRKWITDGAIEFEVKTTVNPQGLPSDASWAGKFSTSYYTYYFKNNRAVYICSPDRPYNSLNQKYFCWYNNYTDSIFAKCSGIVDLIHFSGKQMAVEWKLFAEDITEIAGFKCRKARAILFDSVYVYAYYTDEITISGGPMNLYGLPGMILGVTIPRYRTSWIAIKVSLDIPKNIKIEPVKKGKQVVLEEKLQEFKINNGNKTPQQLQGYIRELLL